MDEAHIQDSQRRCNSLFDANNTGTFAAIIFNVKKLGTVKIKSNLLAARSYFYIKNFFVLIKLLFSRIFFRLENIHYLG